MSNLTINILTHICSSCCSSSDTTVTIAPAIHAQQLTTRQLRSIKQLAAQSLGIALGSCLGKLFQPSVWHGSLVSELNDLIVQDLVN